MVNSCINIVRKINSATAQATGIVLVLCMLLIIVDIILREAGVSFGASDEISGYVMACVSGWGMSYTLTGLAHVRIDMIRQRLRPFGRSLMDLLAIVALSTTSITIAYYSWPVLQKSIERNSRANTALETPLWIPQSIWFAGWIWFAISSVILVFLAFIVFLKGDYRTVDELIGSRSEMDL